MSDTNETIANVLRLDAQATPGRLLGPGQAPRQEHAWTRLPWAASIRNV